MKAYRIYHTNEQGKKIYSCCQPGYWSHHCSDPEYAVPYIELNKAQEVAALNEKYVAPSGKRYVEEYQEDRPLVQYKDNVILAAHCRYYHDGYMYKLIATPA